MCLCKVAFNVEYYYSERTLQTAKEAEDETHLTNCAGSNQGNRPPRIPQFAA
jgi:hypothetical protein